MLGNKFVRLSIGLVLLAALLVPAWKALATSGTPQVAWTSSMVNAGSSTASNFTCRWITRPSIAGNTIRIHLSNLFSASAETFGAVTVGIRTSRAAVS